MFETANTTVYARASRKTMAGAIAVSILAHGAMGVAALAGDLWHVDFPIASPPMMVAFSIATPPPPPPPPKAAPKPKTETPRSVAPATEVAPTVIPDEIPVLQKEIVASVAGSTDGVEGGGEGIDESAIGGVIGGVVGGVLTDTVQRQHTVQIPRDQPLPMHAVSQEYPEYPESARAKLWEDYLVVRYVIGKDGRVVDVSVIKPPAHEIFVEHTLRAIRGWRFTPLIRDGERVEVVHELTVIFEITRQ